MTQYARVVAGDVVEPLFTPPEGFAITDCFSAAIAAQFVAVPSGPTPAQGWTAAETSGTWTFTAPVAASPTLAQQAAALLAGGLAITSAGTPGLDATYPADAVAQGKLLGVQAVLAATAAFPGGATTWPVKDAAGAWHVCTAAQFTAIAVAIAAFVAPCDLIMDGHAGISLPASSVTIA